MTRIDDYKPTNLAERYALRWLKDHVGEDGVPTVRSLANMMVQWRANDPGKHCEACARAGEATRPN